MWWDGGASTSFENADEKPLRRELLSAPGFRSTSTKCDKLDLKLMDACISQETGEGP